MVITRTSLIAAGKTLGLAIALSFGALLPASAQSHVYTLNNTYADTNGGPSLTPDGGTLNPTGGYTFGKDQGLTVSNVLTGADYTIDMTFSLTTLGGYKKLLDFNNLNDDAGLCLLGGNLNFFPVATGTFSFAIDQPITVELTRNAATQVVTGFADGIQQFSFVDTGGIAVFKAPGGVMYFFEDDKATGGDEASGGTVTNITINGSAPVPEASTTVSLGLLLALGLGGAVAARRKKSAG